ncbi:MAG: hypothetical protein ACR2FY_15090 [Pirellulaceae bacterium]
MSFSQITSKMVPGGLLVTATDEHGETREYKRQLDGTLATKLQDEDSWTATTADKLDPFIREYVASRASYLKMK